MVHVMEGQRVRPGDALVTFDPELVRTQLAELTGRLETWRRWSPADSQIRLSPDEVWVDVHKTIVKRRFDGDGNEAPMTEAAYASIGVACDVEVAAIEVLGQRAWSLALAAIGPDTSRQDSILTTWAALGPNRPACLGSDLHLRDSCGYPEWLIKTTTPQHRGPQIEATTFLGEPGNASTRG